MSIPSELSNTTSLNNLAELYRTTGNYAAALPLYQLALAIHETVLGPMHPDTASSLNNLGTLYRVTGKYADALPLYQGHNQRSCGQPQSKHHH
jgi:tetratricopeptide (TPR) repeat protein